MSSTELERTIGIAYACSFPALAIVLYVLKVATNRLSGRLRSLQNQNPKLAASVRWVKTELLYAPLLRQRRARQITFIHDKLNLGALLDRLQSIFIFLILGTNIFLIEWKQPFSESTLEVVESHNRRLGVLAAANLVPIILTSSIHNPVISLLGISYDSMLNLHRWIARIVVLETVAHVLCHVCFTGTNSGWGVIRYQFQHVPFFIRGLTGAILFFVILLASMKPIRSMAYEVFHYLHIGLVLGALAAVWLHLQKLPLKWFILTSAVLWAALRLSRLALLAYRSFGARSCVSTIELLPGDAVKVAIQPSRPWHFRPGQSIYLAIPGIDLLGAHPFSVAWSDQAADASSTKSLHGAAYEVPLSHLTQPSRKSMELKEIVVTERQTLYCIIKKHSGMTRKLHERAEAISNGEKFNRLEYQALVAGPYGSQKGLDQYQGVLLFAGGVGITHQLSYVKQILEDQNSGKQTPTFIHLVWIAPSTDVLEWIKPWARELADLQRSSQQASTLDLYVTRTSGTQLPSEDGPFNVLSGRPDVAEILASFVRGHSTKKTFVSVCAGGSLSDDVRSGVRQVLKNGHNLDFHEEGFGW